MRVSYDLGECVIVFTVRADGTATDILTTTGGALVRDSSCGGDTSDELYAGARAQLACV